MYRVYLTYKIKGIFSDKDNEYYEWSTNFFPNLKRKEIDNLIDSLNKDMTFVSSECEWIWIEDDNCSKVLQKHLDIIENNSMKLITPSDWLKNERK